MISDEQQDQAALYVLGLLDASEAAALESTLRGDAELGILVRDLREAAGAIALSVPPQPVPPVLKERILRAVAAESHEPATFRTLPARSVAISWLPWAIAALFVIFCGILATESMRLRRALAEARAFDPLAEINFFSLAPSSEGPSKAKAVVAWEPARQSGMLHVTNLPAAQSGKDYQLWAVDAEKKEPISAGVIHVDSNGVAEMRFKPAGPAPRVKAFAVSLERAGGSPKKQGPILLLGTGET